MWHSISSKFCVGKPFGVDSVTFVSIARFPITSTQLFELEGFCFRCFTEYPWAPRYNFYFANSLTIACFCLTMQTDVNQI